MYGAISRDSSEGEKIDFAVRIGKFKFYNYLQELPTILCDMQKTDIVQILPEKVKDKQGYAQ